MTLPLIPPRQGGTGLTSLAALPISTAQQAALDLKADKTQLATPSVQRFSVADSNLTAGQTTITVNSYTPGTVVVFINGSKVPTNAYTASSGTTVVLADAVQAPDVVEIMSWLMSGVQNAAPISHQHSTADLTGPALPLTLGGTNATTASGARASLGAAAAGANSDITSLTGLTTPLSQGQGGTGVNNPTNMSISVGGASDLLGNHLSGALYGRSPIVLVTDPQFAGGAKLDGTTDDTAAIVAALATGKDVGIPYTAAGCKVTGTLTLASKQRLAGVGGRTKLTLVSTSVARLFSFDGATGAEVSGFSITGNKDTVAAGAFVTMANSTDCRFENNDITNAPGTVVGCVVVSGNSTGNRIRRNTFVNCGGSGVGLTGSGVKGNIASRNAFQGGEFFGFRLGEGTNANELSFNRTTSNGIELIGITHDCYDNRVVANHAEGCGDNGISVTGFKNAVVGNRCHANAKAGIWIWGSLNTVTGNVCTNNNQENAGNNWAGIGVSANYGGCGQINSIVGNACDDDQATPTQAQGVREAGVTYNNWATGVVTASNQYIKNGLNIYYSTAAGTTGATAPTHTSGTVSDGGVTWRYIRSFVNSAIANNNVVGPNSLGRAVNGLYFGSSGWNTSGNALYTQTEMKVGAFTSGTSGGGNVDVFCSTAANARYTVNGTKVLGPRKTGWTASSGTGQRSGFTTYDAPTISASPTQSEVQALANALQDVSRTLHALITDLHSTAGHGIIGT
jgi:parallel beta-helix repeat protein